MEVIPEKNIVLGDLVVDLRAGNTIVYPTETCYGLGCDAFNATAVAKIFAIKGRETGKPVLVLVDSIKTAHSLIQWNDVINTLAEKYWPGPLTLVARALHSDKWPPGILGSDDSLALRVSNHPVAAAVVAGFGGPLVSTSANLAGDKNAYRIIDIVMSIGRGAVRPDILIDAGALNPQPPSTIARVGVNQKIEILRQGNIIVQ